MPRPLALALLFLGVVAIWLPSLGAGFVHDDHEVIEVQPRPRSAGDLARVFAEPHFRGLPYYRPVVRVSLLAQKALHGDRPGAFRLGNALLMGTAALLAWGLLRRPGLGVAPGPALGAAALFALHPVASSCVYPIASGRETLLPAVWMLAGVLAWTGGRRGWATVALALALFSKEQAVVLPLLFLLADACGVAADAPAWRPWRPAAWLARYAPVVAVTALYAVARGLVLGGGGLALAVDDRPLGPVLSYLYALQTVFAPFVALVYEPDLDVWWSWPRLAAAAAALVALAVAMRAVGAPPRRAVVFWVGWFVVAQLPTANWLEQEAAFAERYVFLAWLAGPALLAGWAGAAWERWERPRARRALVAAGAAACLAAAATSVTRATWFRDDATFALQWLRTNPRSPDAHHVYGVHLLLAGRPAEAVEHLEAARRWAEPSPDIHVNLAIALARSGRTAEAIRELEAALRLAPDHPEARHNLERLRRGGPGGG